METLAIAFLVVAAACLAALIRQNGNVRRLRRHNRQLVLELEYVAAIFEHYASLHEAKGTDEAALKAKSNRDIAAKLRHTVIRHGA